MLLFRLAHSLSQPRGCAPYAAVINRRYNSIYSFADWLQEKSRNMAVLIIPGHLGVS